MLAVKENQGQLYENIQDLFQGAQALGFDGVLTPPKGSRIIPVIAMKMTTDLCTDWRHLIFIIAHGMARPSAIPAKAGIQ